MRKLFLASVAVLAFTGAAQAEDAWCGRPTVFLGDTYDPDPVTSVRVQYNPNYHTWNVLLYSGGGGRVVSRSQQYAITDYSADEVRTWGGSLNRNRNLYMVGELHENGVYEEWLYDRSQHNRLDMHWSVRCQFDVAYPNGEPPLRHGQQISPDWDPAPVKVVPVVPVVPVAPPAPVIVQQAAPPVVTVAPVIVIPGVTGAGTIPAPPAERLVPPAEKGS